MSNYIGNTPGFGQGQTFIYILTAGQSSVSGPDALGRTLAYTPGLPMIVAYNGALQSSITDFTATNGNSISFNGWTANAGDEFVVIAFAAFALADTLKPSNNLTDLVDPAAARTALNLVPGTAANQIVRLDGSARLPAIDGSQLTGIQSLAGFRNKIINGDFRVWQRGTTFNTPASQSYTADRWRLAYDGTGSTFTISRQPFVIGQTAVPGEPAFFLRHDQTVAGSGGTVRALVQNVEGVRTFAGQTLTFSAWIRASAAVNVGAGINQNFGAGGSPSAGVGVGGPVLSANTNWQRFSWTTTLPSISGKTLGTNNNDCVEFVFYLPNNTAVQVDFANVQVEPGSTATTFEDRPLTTEFALCQRYYEKSFPLATVPAQNAGTNGASAFTQSTASGSTSQGFGFRFTVPKRAAPTMTLFNPNAANAQIRNINTGTDGLSSAIGSITEFGFVPQTNPPASSAAGQQLVFHWTADAEL